MENITTTFDVNNREQMNAYKLISETNQSFFLTGRAGTGKTTFINKILKTVNKNFVLLAPTGKAALLIGGNTLHSYFGFKPLELTPHSIGSSKNIFSLASVDTFIIDEVSMLRCDWLDAMDTTLRHVLHSSLPFGGKQVVFCGDLYQLAPVVSKKDKGNVEMLMAEYGTTDAFFYKAHALKYLQLPKIEFQKVYRQNDSEFLSILEHIRTGQIVPNEIDVLNQRILTPSDKDKPYVILSGRNEQIDKINSEFLNAIDSPAFTYNAKITGKVNPKEKEFPAEKELVLKVGAQVMFCKNDMCNRWVNGTLGTVTELDNEKIAVRTENGDDVTVDRVSWEQATTKYDPETKKMTREVQKVFSQYPLRLAWAMTIHKSQGATFDRMLLDLEKGGIFADGQLYVALTRVRSIDGLFLNAPINYTHIRNNKEVMKYAEGFNDTKVIDRSATLGKELYTFEKESDYDSIAALCLKEMSNAIGQREEETAYIWGKRMMQTMISDENLYGTIPETGECPSDFVHSNWVNAIISLYSNKYEEAIKYADLELENTGDIDMLYIKTRALSMQNKHNEADPLFVELLEAQGEAWDYKTLYAIALHNELHTNDSGLSAIHMVVKRYPKYITGLVTFRNLMLRNNRKLVMREEITNPLALVFNSDIDNETFASNVVNCMDNDKLKEFINIIKKQVF